MTIAFDHLVLLVDDLDAAARDFAALGFTVQERADSNPSHGSTVFRFVSLADGSYILLTAFASDAARAGHRLGPVMDAGGGWADYSFSVADAGAAGAALTAAGHATKGPVPVSNVLVSGDRWALDLVMCGRGAGGDDAAPFLVSDVAGRGHRIPAPVPHANGATGIAAVTVASADPRQLADLLVAVGGQEEPGLRIRFGAARVEILALADAPGAPAGGGMVGVTLFADRDAALDPALSHGAPIALARG